MKVIKLGKMNLESKIKLDVNNSIKRCLVYIDRFLVYLRNNRPELIENFNIKIKERLKSANASNNMLDNSYNIESYIDQLMDLRKDQVMIDSIITLHLSLLKIPKDSNWENNPIMLLHINHDRAAFYPRYYLLKVLTEIIDEEEAIQFFKNFVNHTVINYVNRPHIETMREVYELDVKNGQTSESSAYLATLVHEGLYAGRVDSCMGYEALKELNDPILTDLITCYGDFEMVKKTNPNFILTRSCTLHTGPYCDGLYHDTRICKKIEHYPREFYDKLHDEEGES